MKTYLDKIFASQNIEDTCNALQGAIDNLRADGYFASIPDYYEDIQANGPEQVQDWFDEMKDDESANEEGHLKEVYGLFEATLRKLRELGFHRN